VKKRLQSVRSAVEQGSHRRSAARRLNNGDDTFIAIANKHSCDAERQRERMEKRAQKLRWDSC